MNAIPFLSGVLQGCPASAMLFNLALDPFLSDFERKLEYGNKGIVRACADDVAFSLQRLAHLPLLFPVYSAAQRFAGLSLKPRKCKIIPCCKITPETLALLGQWVRRNIPEWGDFEIVGAAELLGFYIGPEMAGHQWARPLHKYKNRVRDKKCWGFSHAECLRLQCEGVASFRICRPACASA